MRTLGRFTSAIGAAVLLTACESAAPDADLTLDVISPNGDEGAALIRLVGAVDTVQTDAAGWLLTDRSADTVWVLVASETPGELSIRVRSNDPGDIESELLEVAGPDDRLRGLSGYALESR